MSSGGSPVDTSVPGNYSLAVTATAADGQSETQTVNYTVAAPPTVSITAPADGAIYVIGADIAAAYECAEGAFGPGLITPDGCIGTVANGASIDTSTPGTHAFTVTATSEDGQVAAIKIGALPKNKLIEWVESNI